MLLNKIIDSYVTLHFEIARMKIDGHLSFSKREALGIRLPSMKRNKSYKKQKNVDLSHSHGQQLWKIPGKKHLSSTNYTFKTKIRIFHQNHGLSLENYQFKLLILLVLQPTEAFFFLDNIGPKWSFFQLFFLGSIGEENVFYDIVKRKNAFLGYKTSTFKKSKNWHFSKRVNPWFWSKNGDFTKSFFKQNRVGKRLLRYSRSKKRLSRL